ncbi:MAG: YdcF family protein [Elusimicrobiales bacterium]|nr:YdcF family protein [Elusimicrobiales bacterium]
MFELKKIISSFLTFPGLFISLSIFLSVYYLIKKNKKNFKIFLMIAVIVYITSIDFFFNYLICRSERKINATAKIDGDVIVVLSAGNTSLSDTLTGCESLSEQSNSRLFKAYQIHRKTYLPLIVTGGIIDNYASDADISKKILISLGVNAKDIFLENKSMDTYQNAIYSKMISDQNNFKKPIIITEAIHIPRSIYLFKKAGFNDVSYYPSSYICNGNIGFMDFLPNSYYNQNKYLHELLGIIYYRIINL